MDAPTERLRGAHRGPVIGPDDDRFDHARRSFNALIDSRPAVIVRPVDDADVVTAIAFAREQGLGVSVRGGGHSVAGHSIGQDSVMIDLRLLREVVVDPDRRTARVGGGACWNDVDAPTQSHGLAMSGGTYGDTGVAGLTLTGGIGHLIGAFGLTLDDLLSARLVTAGGQVVRASAEHEPELFWALRGGGGNFGVVTEFEFALHEVSVMTGGIIIHSFDDAAAALRAFRDMRDDMADGLTLMPALTQPDDYVDAPRGLLTSVAFLGDPASAAAALAPFRQVAEPLFDNIGVAYYSQIQGIYKYMPFGLRNYWTGRFVEDIPDDVIAQLVEHFGELHPGAHSTMLFEPMHGAASRVGAMDTAFAYRHARFNISPIAVWADPSLDEDQIAWAQAARDLLQPLSRGGYLNYATDDGVDTVEGAFGVDTFRRLQAVKRVWDPENLLRFNHNIPPA
jgi:FAD/FMN-containing dehydrogenase